MHGGIVHGDRVHGGIVHGGIVHGDRVQCKTSCIEVRIAYHYA